MYLVQFIETFAENATAPLVDDIYWQGVFETVGASMAENLQDWISDWMDRNTNYEHNRTVNITTEFLESLLEKGEGPHEVFFHKFDWKWASALTVILQQVSVFP
jgi:hypothetical protein